MHRTKLKHGAKEIQKQGIGHESTPGPFLSLSNSYDNNISKSCENLRLHWEPPDSSVIRLPQILYCQAASAAGSAENSFWFLRTPYAIISSLRIAAARATILCLPALVILS